MKEEKFYSLRLKLFVVYMILLFLAVLSVSGFAVHSFYGVYYDQVDSNMADISTLSTTNVSNRLEQIDQLSVSVLMNQTVQDNLDRMNRKGAGIDAGEKSKESLKSEISAEIRASVFNIDGIISMRLYSLYGDEIFIGTTNREYLEYPLESQDIYDAGGKALWALAVDRNYACMCRAILDTDDLQPLGYMVIICRNEYFSEELETISTSYSGEIYLLAEDGTIVSAGNQDMVGGMFPFSPAELKKMDKDTVSSPETGEISYYYIGEELDNGWSLVVLVTTQYFSEGFMLVIRQTVGVLLTVLLVSLVMTILAVRKLLGPTQRVLKSMSEFGDGVLDSRVIVEGHDEIGQIGAAYNLMADNIQTLMEQVYTLELANREAEIEFLKMQINPHFLYNSLDTISWMGYANGNEEISELAVSLANLLRTTVKMDDMIPVRREMQIVQDYLKIQHYRFSDRIEITCQVQEEVMDCRMPGFLLQPLIENSIIHGLEGQTQANTEVKGKLCIMVYRENEWIVFLVEDNGCGMSGEQVKRLLERTAENQEKKEIGLRNVYRRLYLLYGDSCQFVINSSLGKGTRVSFRIPRT